MSGTPQSALFGSVFSWPICTEGVIVLFNDGLNARDLKLVALAQYSRADLSNNLAELIAEHMLIGRFLSSVGGKYINHMLAPSKVLNEGDAEAYRSIDTRTWAKNINEIGRQLFEKFGVKLAYHPEEACLSYLHFSHEEEVILHARNAEKLRRSKNDREGFTFSIANAKDWSI